MTLIHALMLEQVYALVPSIVFIHSPNIYSKSEFIMLIIVAIWMKESLPSKDATA